MRQADMPDEGGLLPPVAQPNRMQEAMDRGGILGWGSYLTFAWAGHFLKLGSTTTLNEEHLESIYKMFKRCAYVASYVVSQVWWYPSCILTYIIHSQQRPMDPDTNGNDARTVFYV